MTTHGAMTSRAVAALALAACVACGGGGKNDEDATDVPEDGTDQVLPDGEDTIGDAPDVPGDLIPEVPCYCGNAVFEPECMTGEECDDGNFENGDDCLTNCKLPTCGDGFRRNLPHDPSDAEECDDGNDTPGDGCESDCTFTCHEDLECDDTNPCTEDFCDYIFHVCEAIPAGEGEVCGTGDVCTGIGTCIGGTCVSSSPLDCDDGHSCTTDTCTGTAGCVHTPLPEGDPCDDGFYCWTGDHCSAYGLCTSDPVNPCDDHDPCTTDLCDEVADSCSHSTPVYRAADCDGTDRGSTYAMPSNYGSYTCPDGSHSEPGADTVYSVAVTASGTLAVTVATPATHVYILSDACSTSSCMAHSTTTASASVTAGTYYIVVETGTGGGSFEFSANCP